MSSHSRAPPRKEREEIDLSILLDRSLDDLEISTPSNGRGRKIFLGDSARKQNRGRRKKEVVLKPSPLVATRARASTVILTPRPPCVLKPAEKQEKVEKGGGSSSEVGNNASSSSADQVTEGCGYRNAFRVAKKTVEEDKKVYDDKKVANHPSVKPKEKPRPKIPSKMKKLSLDIPTKTKATGTNEQKEKDISIAQIPTKKKKAKDINVPTDKTNTSITQKKTKKAIGVPTEKKVSKTRTLPQDSSDSSVPPKKKLNSVEQKQKAATRKRSISLDPLSDSVDTKASKKKKLKRSRSSSSHYDKGSLKRTSSAKGSLKRASSLKRGHYDSSEGSLSDESLRAFSDSTSDSEVEKITKKKFVTEKREAPPTNKKADLIKGRSKSTDVRSKSQFSKKTGDKIERDYSTESESYYSDSSFTERSDYSRSPSRKGTPSRWEFLSRSPSRKGKSRTSRVGKVGADVRKKNSRSRSYIPSRSPYVSRKGGTSYDHVSRISDSRRRRSSRSRRNRNYRSLPPRRSAPRGSRDPFRRAPRSRARSPAPKDSRDPFRHAPRSRAHGTTSGRTLEKPSSSKPKGVTDKISNSKFLTEYPEYVPLNSAAVKSIASGAILDKNISVTKVDTPVTIPQPVDRVTAFMDKFAAVIGVEKVQPATGGKSRLERMNEMNEKALEIIAKAAGTHAKNPLETTKAGTDAKQVGDGVKNVVVEKNPPIQNTVEEKKVNVVHDTKPLKKIGKDGAKARSKSLDGSTAKKSEEITKADLSTTLDGVLASKPDAIVEKQVEPEVDFEFTQENIDLIMTRVQNSKASTAKLPEPSLKLPLLLSNYADADEDEENVKPKVVNMKPKELQVSPNDLSPQEKADIRAKCFGRNYGPLTPKRSLSPPKLVPFMLTEDIGNSHEQDEIFVPQTTTRLDRMRNSCSSSTGRPPPPRVLPTLPNTIRVRKKGDITVSRSRSRALAERTIKAINSNTAQQKMAFQGVYGINMDQFGQAISQKMMEWDARSEDSLDIEFPPGHDDDHPEEAGFGKFLACLEGGFVPGEVADNMVERLWDRISGAPAPPLTPTPTEGSSVSDDEGKLPNAEDILPTVPFSNQANSFSAAKPSSSREGVTARRPVVVDRSTFRSDRRQQLPTSNADLLLAVKGSTTYNKPGSEGSLENWNGSCANTPPPEEQEYSRPDLTTFKCNTLKRKAGALTVLADMKVEKKESVLVTMPPPPVRDMFPKPLRSTGADMLNPTGGGKFFSSRDPLPGGGKSFPSRDPVSAFNNSFHTTGMFTVGAFLDSSTGRHGSFDTDRNRDGADRNRNRNDDGLEANLLAGFTGGKAAPKGGFDGSAGRSSIDSRTDGNRRSVDSRCDHTRRRSLESGRGSQGKGRRGSYSQPRRNSIDSNAGKGKGKGKDSHSQSASRYERGRGCKSGSKGHTSRYEGAGRSLNPRRAQDERKGDVRNKLSASRSRSRDRPNPRPTDRDAREGDVRKGKDRELYPANRNSREDEQVLPTATPALPRPVVNVRKIANRFSELAADPQPPHSHQHASGRRGSVSSVESLATSRVRSFMSSERKKARSKASMDREQLSQPVQHDFRRNADHQQPRKSEQPVRDFRPNAGVRDNTRSYDSSAKGRPKGDDTRRPDRRERGKSRDVRPDATRRHDDSRRHNERYGDKGKGKGKGGMSTRSKGKGKSKGNGKHSREESEREDEEDKSSTEGLNPRRRNVKRVGSRNAKHL